MPDQKISRIRGIVNAALDLDMKTAPPARRDVRANYPDSLPRLRVDPASGHTYLDTAYATLST